MKRNILKEYVSRCRNTNKYGTGIYWQIKNCKFEYGNKFTLEDIIKVLEFTNK